MHMARDENAFNRRGIDISAFNAVLFVLLNFPRRHILQLIDDFSLDRHRYCSLKLAKMFRLEQFIYYVLLLLSLGISNQDRKMEPTDEQWANSIDKMQVRMADVLPAIDSFCIDMADGMARQRT